MRGFRKRSGPAAGVLLLLIALVLCVLVFCVRHLPAKTPAAVYADVTERDWFYPEVRQLVAAGLLQGGTEERFYPAERLTRADAVTLLHRLAGSPVSRGALPADVSPDAACAGAVAWAAEAGIAGGSYGFFQPEKAVTREQLACMLHRYAAYAGLDTQSRGALENYHDLRLVSEYALESVAWADSYDLLNCRKGGALLPGGSVSRALGAVAFSRFLTALAGFGEPEPAAKPGWGERNRVWILMYHDVIPDGESGGTWAVTVSQLREDLEWLTGRGYAFYLPGELAEGTRTAQKAVMLTFDDGYKSVYDLAFPLLKEYGAKAMVAPVVSWIGDDEWTGCLSWDMCREMAESGLVELGSHTYALHDEETGVRRLAGETPEDYAARVYPDLLNSIQLLETETGQRVYCLAYPNGMTEPLLEEFVEAHFAVSLTTKFGIAKLGKGLYDLPRRNIDASTRASVLGSPREWFR